MIRFELASDQHFNDLLEIVYHQEDLYLNPVLDLIQITYDQFGQYFRTNGMVYRVLVDGHLAGLCWVELCGRLLKLHGLIVKNSFQGQGIGTQALYWLEENFQAEIDEIELDVHSSNPRAKSLYERCGYETKNFFDQTGFTTMRKKIRVGSLVNLGGPV